MSQYMGGFNFGEALRQLERGERVTRTGWNGKGMYLRMVPATDWCFCGELECEFGSEFNLRLLEALHYAPFIVMRTADNKLVPWLASQTDILAADWEILDG
ncbi:MAG: DUF2829 domain-containing protein [Bacteroidales bacterium]|jgi:hypothetical protein|nr:DUF2829 domain-containing protein [Bacteroidales bacterium]